MGLDSRSEQYRHPCIIAVGGGKGGVGKSLVSANLGLSLAKAGCQVILLDADLGAANLHTCIGLGAPAHTLSEFLSNTQTDLRSCVSPTPFANLSLISGHNDSLGIANPKPFAKQRLLQQISLLEADYVILDIGSGTSLHTLDFFIAAQIGICVVIPEPTAVENLYRFVKAVAYRRLQTYAADLNLDLSYLLPGSNDLGACSPLHIVQKMASTRPELAQRLKQSLDSTALFLVTNAIKSAAESKLGEQMQKASQQFLGIPLHHVQKVPFDEHVWQSVRQRKPLVENWPAAAAAQALQHLAQKILVGGLL